MEPTSGTYKTGENAVSDDDRMSGYSFDTKIAVVLHEDLAPWQRVNATAFLTSGIVHAFPQLIGEPYEDADGQTYLSMLGLPVFVFEATGPVLRDLRAKAVGRGLATSVFTRDLFSTGNDEDNRAVVAKVAGDDLDVVGLALHGPKNVVDRLVKAAHRHP